MCSSVSSLHEYKFQELEHVQFAPNHSASLQKKKHARKKRWQKGCEEHPLFLINLKNNFGAYVRSPANPAIHPFLWRKLIF